MGEAKKNHIDEALQRLARDVHNGTPQPSDDLLARVATDTALEALARDAVAMSPRPVPDLVARVLADAAAVSAELAPPIEAMGTATGTMPPQTSWTDRLFGWAGGAVAACAVCLSVGVGVGMEIDPAEMPMMGEPESEISLTVVGDLLPEDVL